MNKTRIAVQSNNTKKFLEFFKKNDAPHRWEWIILISLIIVVFLSYTHGDIIVTTRHGTDVWKNLFKGDIFNFYKNEGNAVYPFPLYLIFAVWDFPLFILEKIMHIDLTTSRVMIFYGKCILLPFIYMTTTLIYKLCQELDIEKVKSKWCAFYFLSSIPLLLGTIVQGQYDIISVFFTMLAIFYYIKGNRNKFLIYIAIANSLKMFSLFIAIPLILLKEKKFFRIIFQLILINSLLLFSYIFTSRMPANALNIRNTLISRIFVIGIPLKDGQVPIFVILILLLFLYSYMNKYNKNRTLYVSFLAMSILLSIIFAHPQWYVLLAPYLCIYIFLNKKMFKINYMLEVISTVSIAFSCIYFFYGIYTMKSLNSSVISLLFGKVYSKPESFCIRNIIDHIIKPNSFIYPYIVPIIYAIFISGIIGIAIVNYKSAKSENLSNFNDTDINDIEEFSYKNVRILAYLRTFINFLPYLVFILVFLIERFKHR